MAVAESQVGFIPPNGSPQLKSSEVYKRAPEFSIYSKIGPIEPRFTNESRHHFSESVSPEVIYYAGESVKRKMFLENAFCGLTPVISRPGGEERQIPHVGIIASEKVDNVLLELEDLKHNSFAVIAGDTRTEVQQVGADGKTRLVSLGKPKSISELRSTIVGMAQTVRNNNNPYYLVESGSVTHIHHEGRSWRIMDREACVIELDSKKLLNLAEENGQGLDLYLNAFDAFYSKPPYANQHTMPVNPMMLCGGLSLSVLTKIGAVRRINGISRENPAFRNVLRYGLHTALVGISPSVLRSVHPNPEKTIEDWSWLNRITDHLMKVEYIQ